jgi:acyl-CoA thioester hydrolase
MSGFKFYYPIQVRYGDLDAQWHVNNSKFNTYLEQARYQYLIELGLFDGKSFLDFGLIVADVHVAYRAPIQLAEMIRVGVRVARIGTKSILFEYIIENESSAEIKAQAETLMVAYDYHNLASIPVSSDWREIISTYEGVDFKQPQP